MLNSVSGSILFVVFGSIVNIPLNYFEIIFKMVVINEVSENITISNNSKLSEHISSLYLNQKFSDLTVILNGEKLYAHKVILASRNGYFEALLYDGQQESTKSEITITDVSSKAFRMLLKYIYTGNITIMPSDMDLTLEILGLAHEYLFVDLESAMIEKIKSLLNLKNVCPILNTANLYNFNELKEACLNFLDKHASEIVIDDCFSKLTQESLIKVLERDSFFAPEINIFKGVAKWCTVNNDTDNLVMQYVRLSWLSVVEIVSVVWPTKLVDNEKLLNAIAEYVDVKPRTSKCRAQLLRDENLAAAERKSTVIFGVNTTFLLNGNRDVHKYATHVIGDKNGITIKLGVPSFFNHIHMMLWDVEWRYYCYYIEVSIDQRKWKKVIDYSRYSCRSYQNVYFDQEIAQYIRIVGTHNTANKEFHLIFAEVECKNNVPRVINGIICPTTNVATLDKKALVIEGSQPAPLLNGDTKNYDGSNGYTYHIIGSGSITIELAQPYMIASLKMLLWDLDSRIYKYYIESSINKTDWEMVVDRRNEPCKSWQLVKFTERPIVFIRITGTHNSSNNGLHCVHFECPASSDAE